VQRFGNFLLNNNAYAALIVLLLVVSPVLTLICFLLAMSIVALITLQRGPKAGAFLLLWIAVPTIVTLWFRKFGGYDVVLMLCFLAWGLALLLRRFSSWTLVLEALLIVSLLVLLALHIAVPDIAAWWKSHLLQMYNASSVLSAVPEDEKQRLVTVFSQYATGLFGFYIMLMVILGLMFARYWQALLNDSVGQFSAEVLNIRMNRLISILAMLCFVGFLFKLPLFMDGMSIIFMPFVVAAMSLLHLIARQKQWVGIVVVLLYLGLLFVQYMVAPLLAVLGMLDTTMDFRKRIERLPKQ
jgi:hypothetical protein